MKKIVAMMMLVLISATAYAGDTFAKREADRSGLSGTFSMVGNSISGFFGNIGKIGSCCSRAPKAEKA